MTGQDVASFVLLLSLLVLLVVVAVCDAIRGPRSWSEWWDSLR